VSENPTSASAGVGTSIFARTVGAAAGADFGPDGDTLALEVVA